MENLSTKVLKVYLHDCEQYTDDPQATFQKGKCQFTLRDLQGHFCRELKLRGEVVPTKREEIDNSQILNLNTTARKAELGKESLNPYLENDTYCVINIKLACPIEAFNE